MKEAFKEKVKSMSFEKKVLVFSSNAIQWLATCSYGTAETGIAAVADALPVTSYFSNGIAVEVDSRRSYQDRAIDQYDRRGEFIGDEGSLEEGFDLIFGGVLGTGRQFIESLASEVNYLSSQQEVSRKRIKDDFKKGLLLNWRATVLTAKNNLGTNSICDNSADRIALILK